MKQFTAIVNAAGRDGVAVDYCLHFEGRSASTMTEDAENEFQRLYGDESWQDLGAEIVAFIPGFVQVYASTFYTKSDGFDGFDNDASAAGAEAYRDAQ